jgi:hypothetical protein
MTAIQEKTSVGNPENVHGPWEKYGGKGMAFQDHPVGLKISLP